MQSDVADLVCTIFTKSHPVFFLPNIVWPLSIADKNPRTFTSYDIVFELPSISEPP
jgi:hypothetical protein